jgi:long-chain fatty acid transport protein
MKFRNEFLLISLLLAVAVPTLASNGMNMIGFGSESVAMGGADLALTDNPCSMNINPAGIAQSNNALFEFGLSPMNPSLTHTDAMGNNRSDQLDRYPVPFIGYTHPLRRVTLGIGLFVQGGMGAEYQDLRTPFSMMAGSGQMAPDFFAGDVIPAGDTTQTRLAHAKLTPTVAWRVHPKVTMGVTLNVSQVQADMKLLPETSVMADLDRSGVTGDSPSDAFFGIHLRDASATGYGLKFGAQFKSGPLSLAGAYSTKTDLDLEDGTLTLNMSSMGLGRVNYDATMSNFAWPQQAGLGMAYQISPRVVLAGDVDWVDWADAIETVTIELSNPDVPVAPTQKRRIALPMNWEEQWVWALGAAITPARDWVVRMGYNHGNSPVPASTLKPLFPAIAEDHVTAGFGVTKKDWTYGLALEYVLENTLTNNSNGPTNLFGPGSQETLSQFVAHFQVRRTLNGRTR